MKTRFYLVDAETLEVLDVALAFHRGDALADLLDGYRPGDPVEVMAHEEYVDRLFDSYVWTPTTPAGVAAV
jgi:hypothetical protein